MAKDTSPRVEQRNKYKGELKLKPFQWTENQQKVVDTILDKKSKIVFINGPAGSGKAQPLDAQIITPNGIITMGEAKIGDVVSTPDGKTAKIIAIHPQGIKDIYRVSFSDGSQTECCGEHIWDTQADTERNYRAKIKGKRVKKEKPFSSKTTIDIKNTLRTTACASRNALNHNIPICKEIDFNSTETFVIHPYVMGVLIGDGSITHAPRFTSADKEIVDKIKSVISKDLAVNHGALYSYSITDNNASWRQKNIFTQELINLNLLGKKSLDKFIPDIYKFSSINDRIEVLRGLMDTDGTASKNGGAIFYSISLQLVNDLKWIVESLGGVAMISVKKAPFYRNKQKEKVFCNDCYRLTLCMPNHINPFYLSRKANLWQPRSKYVARRYITNIELIGKKEAQCITINSEEQRYLTNNFLVTHNSSLSAYCGLKLISDKVLSDYLYIRNVLEVSDSAAMGYIKGDLTAKFDPYCQIFKEKSSELMSSADLDKLMNDNRVHFLPINYVRGSSWAVKYINVEEAANFTYGEYKLLLTRYASYSKLVFCGDSMQSDLPDKKKGAFMRMFDLFDNEESVEKGIHCFHLEKCDIKRSDITSYIIDKLQTV